jgi:hypothetical protein
MENYFSNLGKRLGNLSHSLSNLFASLLQKNDILTLSIKQLNCFDSRLTWTPHGERPIKTCPIELKLGPRVYGSHSISFEYSYPYQNSQGPSFYIFI